jgi:hypothetical protein
VAAITAVPNVKQELPTLPEHLLHIQFLVEFVLLSRLVSMFVLLFFVFLFFSVATTWYIFLRFTASDYPVGIFKLSFSSLPNFPYVCNGSLESL